MPPRKPGPSGLGYVIALSQIGIEMVVPIGLGVFLDVWLGTAPWLLVVGVLVGLFGGMAHMMVILRRMDRREPPDSSRKPT